MARNSLLTQFGDGVAKRLWSGDVQEANSYDSGAETYRRSRSEWSATEVSVQKATEPGLRRGRVPEHIEEPIKGKSRTTNPLSLRTLAKSGTVQSTIGAILGDMEDIPWSVVPIDEKANPDDNVLEEAERALRDLNPNPETFDDMNAMLGRDLLEVGNCANILSFEIEGRRVEAITYDPSSFTVDWDKNRVLEGFYQYPKAEQRWGDPQEFDRDEVMWGVMNPTTTRAGFYGYPPLEMVERFINIMGGLVDKEVKELEEGMPSGMISLVGEEWSDRDYENFKTYWKNDVKGEQIKHPVAQGDAKFIPFNMTYKELQVLDRQKWYSKLVSAAFRVPVSETGLAIGEEMTRATDVSMRQKYKKRALGSLLGLLEDLWTYQYLHRYFSEEIKVQFDPGRDIMERRELSLISDRQLRNGTRTINEVREEEGRDPVPWGDVPLFLQSKGQDQTQTQPTNPDDGSVFSDEESNQNALGPDGEGLQQDQTPTQDGGDATGNFSDGGSGVAIANAYAGESGTWLPDGVEVVATKALRHTDTPWQFSFQPNEIDTLQEDIERVYRGAIESVLERVKDNPQLLRSTPPDDDRDPADAIDDVAGRDTGVWAEKNIPAYQRLIREEIGLSFAEDVGEVLTEHKTEKILGGEQDILTELSQAGLSVEDVDLEPVRDRVVERLTDRTLEVTKPISDRLEADLREVLSTGWTEGQSITEIEQGIEDVSEKWRGHEAERLARDQLSRAAKEGRTEFMRATGSEVGGWSRTWISTDDSRTREAHARMDGETVGQDEPWTVNYTAENGPATVKEDYPGESRFGIQCRCSFSLSPSATIANVKKWASDPTPRMKEVANEQDKSIGELMLAAELGPESRTHAAKRFGLSKDTYYRWARESGLYNR